MDDVNAAIIVLLILLAIGIVLSPLLRMRAWLKKPADNILPPPDDESD